MCFDNNLISNEELVRYLVSTTRKSKMEIIKSLGSDHITRHIRSVKAFRSLHRDV